MPLAQHRIE